MQIEKGIIIRVIRKGKFGFIQPDNSEMPEMFFHMSGLIEPRDFDSLREGLPVSYYPLEDKKSGKPRAIGVVANLKTEVGSNAK